MMNSLTFKSFFTSRYSIDYHLLRNYLHMVDEWGKKRAEMTLPLFSKIIIDQYRSSDDSFRKLEDYLLQKKSRKD